MSSGVDLGANKNGRYDLLLDGGFAGRIEIAAENVHLHKTKF